MITTHEQLRALYAAPGERAVRKQQAQLDAHCQRFIALSPFCVLASGGVLVFKWNETQVKVGEVLALAPAKPLFGQVSGRRGMTHWLVFMKP